MRAGDILGEESPLRSISLGRPTLSVEISPERPEDSRKLYEALVMLSDEDPMLDIRAVEKQSKLTVQLFGEIQMEILKEVLVERYSIPVVLSNPMTLFMETPLSAASARIPMGSGHPFRAGVGIRVEPLPIGSGIEYKSEVWFGSLEKMFQKAVEDAVYETCKQGIYGWEITDARIIFDYFIYDSVTSTPSDYRNLTPLVLMEAFVEAGMGLLEPILSFELRVPVQTASKALYDCERMRGIIENTTADGSGDGLIITGLVPADTCKGYGAQTASYTEGKGVFLTRFHGYRHIDFDAEKVNQERINPAANKRLYLMGFGYYNK
jgi:ribosomal protection tetracycline resistance protein